MLLPDRATGVDQVTWDQWSAEGYGKNRLDRWQDLICREMLNVNLNLPNPARFRCSLSRKSIGGVRIIRFRSTSHSVERTTGMQSSVAADFEHYMLSAQINGITRIRSNDDHADLRPGEVGVLDASRPFVNEFVGDTARAVVLFDKNRFERYFGSLAVRKLPTQHPYFKLVRQQVLSLADPSVNHDPAVADILISGLVELIANISRPSARRLLGEKCKITKADVDHFIRTNVHRLDLCPKAIAAEFSVSLRSLYLLYEGASLSLEQAIIAIRLEEAIQILSSKGGQNETLTTVSTSVGFKDSAHFSRRFHEQFGMSPSEWRRRVAALKH
jgi:AraC family transcriptional regulator, positive regulator of tynA and feaB